MLKKIIATMLTLGLGAVLSLPSVGCKKDEKTKTTDTKETKETKKEETKTDNTKPKP